MELRNRLCVVIDKQEWDEFIEIIKPKMFHNDDQGNKMDRRVVAKLAQLLTKPEWHLPNPVINIILKCLINSCIPATGYPHKTIVTSADVVCQLNHWNKIYEVLSNDSVEISQSQLVSEYPQTFFPYDGVILWVINYLINIDPQLINEEQLTTTRHCFAFLCNITMEKNVNLPNCIYQMELKKMAINLLRQNIIMDGTISLYKAICCFIANIQKTVDKYFDDDYLTHVIDGLLVAHKLGINVANDNIMTLINVAQCLRDSCTFLAANDKLHLLEVLYENLKQLLYKDSPDNNDKYQLSDTAVKYIAEQFKQKSDAILKTAVTYVDDVEPVEVTILLDILCVLTSTELSNNSTLKTDTSLLINAVYLLKALHLTGKETNNYFTSIQKLSAITATSNINEDINTSCENAIENHPAFGFKAALIRLIGNLVCNKRENQNTVRDLDGIPLLLDCCNIDARNPLIMQWAIFAIKNLCEGNSENQEIIRASQKIRPVDSEIIKKSGLTLNQDEDGQAVGIIPIPRDA